MSIRKKLRSIILSASLILATMVCPIQALAESEDGIPINVDYFPDSVLRLHIVENYDVNSDGVLSQEEADKVTELNLHGSPHSYQGIEFFPKLEVLICSYDGYSFLDHELDVSHNPELRVLICSFAPITNLDVSHNPNLEQLECHYAKITSLDVTHNPNLEQLGCAYTTITSLDVSNNPKLSELNCSGTKLKDLNLQNNLMLQHLVCDGTSLPNLDLSKNSRLEYLSCWFAKLTSLDVSHNPSLQSLNCAGTKITNLDVSNNPNLQTLECMETGITNLDVSHNPNLKTLFCYKTGITSLDLQKNNKLDTLNVNACPLLSLLVPTEFNGSVFAGDQRAKLAPYKLILQSGQDSIDLKSIAPTIQADKILDLKGCKRQGTVLKGLKDGQMITYRYDYNGGSINVTIEVNGGGGQPETSAQKPVISNGEGYITVLSKDGSAVSITVKDGYTLNDVKVNGISKGKLTLISGLKTGDVVVITVSKNEAPVQTYDLSDAIVTIPEKSYTYTGKYIRPVPTVTYDGKKLTKGIDYTVTYVNHKNVGTAKVTVSGIGDYSGSEILEFKIIPKKVTLSSVKSSAKKSIIVKWKEVPQATGYQVQWSKFGKFSSSFSKKVKGSSVTDTKISKLNSKKKYNIRVRAYKVVNGTTYYGKWSTVKTAKVK